MDRISTEEHFRGKEVVSLLVRLRPLMQDAVLKSGVFAGADYPAFEDRYGRILQETPPEEHDRLRAGLLAPILSRNGLKDASETEIADYRRYFNQVSGLFAEGQRNDPYVFGEGRFRLGGPVLKAACDPVRGQFEREPLSADEVTAFGAGAVRYGRPISEGMLMSLVLHRRLPGELAIVCFIEKDGKGAPVEPWSLFNFPANWHQVRTEADLQELVGLLFRCCNLFCDAANDIGP